MEQSCLITHIRYVQVGSRRPSGPSTPARFDAEWELHPAERREVVVFNRRCYENRYSRAFGDVSYALKWGADEAAASA